MTGYEEIININHEKITRYAKRPITMALILKIHDLHVELFKPTRRVIKCIKIS